MFVAFLEQEDLMWLAWAAGLAVGSGNTEAGNSLGGILSKLQEVPEDVSSPFVYEEQADPQLSLVPEPDRAPDPNFMPPPPAPPMNRPDDFGAGPPPQF
jgi:hypothetical protein